MMLKTLLTTVIKGNWWLFSSLHGFAFTVKVSKK